MIYQEQERQSLAVQVLWPLPVPRPLKGINVVPLCVKSNDGIETPKRKSELAVILLTKTAWGVKRSALREMSADVHTTVTESVKQKGKGCSPPPARPSSQSYEISHIAFTAVGLREYVVCGPHGDSASVRCYEEAFSISYRLAYMRVY